jgi:hypothetical protein
MVACFPCYAYANTISHFYPYRIVGMGSHEANSRTNGEWLSRISFLAEA